MCKGNFITIKPQDPVIGRYIDYYYFHTSNDPGFHNKFAFYPNYKHALTLYLNSVVSVVKEGTVITPSDSDKFTPMYSVNTHQSFDVSLSGCFYKIGIVFNPLGINHFIDKPLCDLFTPSFLEFNYFGKELEAVVKSTYADTNFDNKAKALDVFFSSRYCGFNEPVVKMAVQEILNSNGGIKVEDLSDKTEVNRKTLLRLFKKHLCASVEEYKKLVMFRNALNYSQQSGSSLTDVALYSLYYDQAHYIKHFKAVTHHSPKALLSNLTQLGNQEVYWHFED